MNKHFRKLLSMALALLMCLSVFALVACDPQTEGPEGEESSGPAAEPQKIISVDSLANYYVVRPDTQNEDIIAAVKALDNALSEKLSVNTKGITTDFILEGNDQYKEHELEIIIGETNREATATFISELEYKEYGYAVIGDKIVIAGLNVTDTVTAVEKFIADIIDGHEAGNATFITDVDKYICEFEHKFDNITINGTDIKEFEIVYKKTKACAEDALALQIQDIIGKLSGVKVKAVSNNLQNNTAKQIVITDGKAVTDALRASKDALINGAYVADKFFIMADDNVIWISADNLAGLLSAMKTFETTLSSSDGGNVTFKSASYDVDNPQIRVMSYNVYVGTNDEIGGPAQRREGVVKTILKYMPDTLGVQEASLTWMSYLGDDLKDTYDYVGIGRETISNTTGKSLGEHCAIFYNKEKLNLIESNTYWLSDTPNKQSIFEGSSYIRIMTYAIFERKSDGVRFLHVNTHMDWGDASIKQFNKLIELIDNIGFEGITFVTGDFNCTPGSAGYKIMTDAGYVDSFNIANASSETKVDKVIDFCFIKGAEKLTVENHYIAKDLFNNGKLPSDHKAVYTSVIVKKSEEN